MAEEGTPHVDPTPPRPAPIPVRIRYCTQCRWLTRAAWLAQELLTTFPTELTVTLEPGFGGVFEVELEGVVIFSRAERRRFPEPKELKQKIRDRVDPARSLGHSDQSGGQGGGAEQARVEGDGARGEDEAEQHRQG